ncbi:MAG: DUF4178 domain-containing protein [Cyclobacteriaceae bacterium]|nr:DUF4178 domain-containing protein [Cyclobacteriaceae bacterium HetDA_MAG_MS6]
MFNLFKKKKEEPEYDVTNLSVNDLDFGFIFDYDLKSWVVKEVYEYDWGDNNFTREYKVDSGDEIAYLDVDDGELSVSKPIKLREIEEDVFEAITEKEKAPGRIHYGGETYYLQEDSAGYFRDCAKETKDWEELITLEYYNEEETLFVSLTQWDDRTLECYAGKVVKSFEVSNIIPGQ